MRKLCLSLFLLLLLSACSPAIDHSRLPLQDYDYLRYSQEQIDEYFWQMINDTPQARNMAYKIWLTLGYSGNLTGDFTGIENAPMDKLIDQAIFSTPAIAYAFYHEGDEYQKNNIVSRVYVEASQDGQALGDIFYAEDIEQTLILLYGDYPIEGESYRDHFTNADLIEYYPEEGLFLQRFDWGGARKKPLILDLYEIEGTIVCDFISVDPWYFEDHFGYIATYEVELTPENFFAETADLDVLRFTFRYATDDNRPLLHQVESLGKLGDLADMYGVKDYAVQEKSFFAEETDFELLPEPDAWQYVTADMGVKLSAGLADPDTVIRYAWSLIENNIGRQGQISNAIFLDAEITRLECTDRFTEFYNDRVIEAYALEYRLKTEDSSIFFQIPEQCPPLYEWDISIIGALPEKNEKIQIETLRLDENNNTQWEPGGAYAILVDSIEYSALSMDVSLSTPDYEPLSLNIDLLSFI